jgi:hypothetical protein
MLIKDRIKELRRVKASELIPNPKNWRTHPDNQKNALKSILAEIGYADAVLAYETPSGLMLVDGHLRAETTPENLVPVLVLDITPAEADKLLATLDPLAALAHQDTEKLAELFIDLKASGDALANLVWPAYVIDPLITADWKPEAYDEAIIGNGKDSGKKITIGEENMEVWKQAAAHAKKEMNDSTANDESILVWICQQWLGDVS